MASLTTRLQLRKPDGVDLVNVLTDLDTNLDLLDANPGIFIGTAAARAALVGAGLWDGRVAFETDTKLTYQYDVTAVAWVELARISAMTAYVPVWGGVGVAIGNGGILGRFIRRGKMMDIFINLVVGSTSTLGAAVPWTFTLPAGITPRAGVAQYIPCGLVNKAALGIFPIWTEFLAGINVFRLLVHPTVTNAALAYLQSNQPTGVWAAADGVFIQCSLEIT